MDQARQIPAHRIHAHPIHDVRNFAWMIVIAGTSVGTSLAFACATPFAALGAVAALQLRRREAIGAVLLAWIANQAIGYLVLGYPRSWDSFAWGGAIGIAAILAAALTAMAVGPARRALVGTIAAFAAAFVAYEGALLLASFVLPSEGNAFTMRIVVRILAINAVAYALLLVLHRLAVGLGLRTPATRPRVLATID